MLVAYVAVAWLLYVASSPGHYHFESQYLSRAQCERVGARVAHHAHSLGGDAALAAVGPTYRCVDKS
jgi:hypothetical protein